jgi:hypothetical protein
MKSWSILSTLALASALVASPVLAGEPTGSRSSSPDEGSMIRDGALQPERRIETPEIPDGVRIEGLVTAIEHSTGRIVLETADGPLNLTAAPEDLEGIAVGDVVLISLATDSRH